MNNIPDSFAFVADSIETSESSDCLDWLQNFVSSCLAEYLEWAPVDLMLADPFSVAFAWDFAYFDSFGALTADAESHNEMVSGYLKDLNK